MTPEEEERRGAEAKAIINHPIYREAYETIRNNIVSQLALADTPDDKRQRLNYLLIALHKVESYLGSVVASGKMVEIERERSLRDRILRRA